jgi:hypothetical protein
MSLRLLTDQPRVLCAGADDGVRLVALADVLSEAYTREGYVE